MDEEESYETGTSARAGSDPFGAESSAAASTSNLPISPTRSVMIVMSPKAGTGLHREQLPRLIEHLQRSGIDVSATDEISHLREFSRHRAATAGGQATLSSRPAVTGR